MDADKWKKVELLCYEAIDMDPPEQDTYLENSCGSDRELLAEVKSLLAQTSSDQLQQPFAEVQSSFVFSEDQSISDHTIGPYRIIKILGSGGMGRVYLAVRNDDQFERFVALKVIRKGLVSDDVLARFYKERQILASLNHPNIARLFDGGTTSDGMPWFAMEYIEGKPITEYCNLHDVSLEEKIKLFLTVCSAVQYAHQNLVIHHDLKPANILITPNGTPKLLDFGIAKLKNLDHSSDQKLNQQQIMTPEYAAPEQVRDDLISTVSDVYALGVLLYELLTESLPYQFEERSQASFKQTISNTIPRLPSAITGDRRLKWDLDSITMKALRKDPAERYASVEQLANDLIRYQKSLPVLAHKTSFAYHAGKFLLRNKWSTVVSAVVALLLITFATVTYIQSRAIEDRAIEAERQRDRAEQVSSFLTDLFESADPSEAKNQSLTAVELLHRGVDRIEQDLGDQPQMQSNLYLVISDVYETLGLFDEGLELARQAYVLLRKRHEGNHPEIARSLNSMGWLHRQKGNYKEADSLLKSALTMRRQLFGDEHLDVARSLNDLAVLRHSRGDYAAADTLLQEAIKIRKKINGEQHESIAVALSNYAALKYQLGDLAAAENRMREALQIFQATVGNEDMRTANVMTNLAAILTARQKIDNAVTIYQEALNIRLQLLGEDHPDVADSYAHLGNLLRAQRKFDEAEELLVKALELRIKLLGEEHVQVGDSKRILGKLYQDKGEFSESENYYTGAVKTFKKVLSEGHARTAGTLHLLGELYLSNERPLKAEQPLREAFVIRKKIFGKNDKRTIDSMIKLGVSLAKNGEAGESKSLLRSGLEVLDNLENGSYELRTLAERTLSEL